MSKINIVTGNRTSVKRIKTRVTSTSYDQTFTQYKQSVTLSRFFCVWLFPWGVYVKTKYSASNIS